MKKSTLLSIALICLSTTSYATQPTGDGTVCNGNGSCGSTTTNNTTNQGGNGIGQGGSASSVATGGSSTAFGGAGGSAYNGGNTSVNTNTVKNESTNIQGQQQAIKNSGNSSSTSSSNNSGNNTGNASNSVTVQGDSFESARNPVNTAYAPSIAPSANCSLGISGGVSFVGFSGSFGKAYTDKDCVANEDIRNVAIVLGDKETAEEMKCISSPAYRKARAALNRPCAVEQE